jgi:hypothetical protein
MSGCFTGIIHALSEERIVRYLFYTCFCLEGCSEKLNCGCVPSAEFCAARSVGLCVMTSAVIMQCYRAVCYQVAESRSAHRKKQTFCLQSVSGSWRSLKRQNRNPPTPVQSSATQFRDSDTASLDVRVLKTS